MPGTILVSVLEFKGLQSSSSSSSTTIPPQMSIKVSVGKREYRTWDKEDFSFPLTTLRDNLMLTLHDVEGNEISRTGIETRLVVEKGIWDDIFTLEGGGYVHLKLQFVLSEEEQRRICDMRESALIKKHGENSIGDPRSPENATTVGSNPESPLCLNQEVSDLCKNLLQSEVMTTPAGLLSIPVDVIENIRVETEEREETFSGPKETKPDDTDRYKEEASSLLESSGTAVAAKYKLITPKLEEAGTNNTEKQSPVGRIPSNVRNIISAFESSLSQDIRTHMKPPPAIPQSSKVATEASLMGSRLDEVKTEKTKPTQSMAGRIKNPFLTGDLQQAIYAQKGGDQLGSVGAFNMATTSWGTRSFDLGAADVKTKGTTENMNNHVPTKEIREWEKSSEELMRASTSKAATISGRMLDKNTGRQQPSKLLLKQQDSSGKLCYEEVDNKGTWKDNYSSFSFPSTWIFPVESRRLCITTGSKQMMDLIQSCHTEAENPPGQKGSHIENVEKSSRHHGHNKVNEVEKNNQKPKKPKFENSADGETSGGPVGQVMKVGIMIGFTTLVFFTRQRNNSY